MMKYNALADFMRDSSTGLLRRTGNLGLAAAVGLVLATGANASVVFEQSPVNGNDAFPSGSSGQSADDFVLAASTSISSLVWWGSYLKPPTNLSADEFRVSISSDDGSGHPAMAPTVEITQAPTRTLTSLLDVADAEVYRYELALARSLILAGGTTFYLSVVNEFDLFDQNAWYWLLSDAVGTNFYRAASLDPWENEDTGNLAFAMDGTTAMPVPVPGTLLLLLSALAGLSLPGSRGRASLVGRAATG